MTVILFRENLIISEPKILLRLKSIKSLDCVFYQLMLLPNTLELKQELLSIQQLHKLLLLQMLLKLVQVHLSLKTLLRQKQALNSPKLVPQ